MAPTTGSKRICAHNTLFRLEPSDLMEGASARASLDRFCDSHDVEQMLYATDGTVALTSSKQVHLKNGMTTLQRHLGLSYAPTLVSQFKPLPTAWLAHAFADGYDASKIIYAFGPKYSEAAITAVNKSRVSRVQNKIQNDAIGTKSIGQMKNEGVVPFSQLLNVERVQRVLARRINDRKRLDRDLHGSKTYTLEQRRKIDGKIVPTGAYAPTLVTVHGFPTVIRAPPPNHSGSGSDTDADADTNAAAADDAEDAEDGKPLALTYERTELDSAVEKCKHLYVYSKEPGFGKTQAFAKHFATDYNACVVNDVNNWSKVSPAAQFLIFDEVTRAPKRHIDLATLKAFTGGTVTTAAGNIKSYGDSYEPREDVQLIMLSNESIYDIYGTWDAKLQRRFMPSCEMNQLNDRFVVVRLDGDVDEDRRRCMSPADWTREELVAETVEVFHDGGGGGGGLGAADQCCQHWSAVTAVTAVGEIRRHRRR